MKNLVYAACDSEGIIAIFLYQSDCREYCETVGLQMRSIARDKILSEF